MKHNPDARTRRGTIVNIAGIVLNFALALSKALLGFLTGLISLVADGVNNLSDCGSGAVSLVSFRIAEKPADREHPYGHQRAEYVASMIISFFVLLCAAELLREGIEKILSGESPAGNIGVYILLGVSVAVKAGMCAVYFVFSRKLASDALRASAIDSACDCLATLAVGAGLALSAAGIPADGYAALVVALFIVWEGCSLLKDASSKLLGRAPDPALVARIREIVLGGEGVLGVHDLRVYRYGPRKFFATAHVEMSADLPSVLSHSRIDAVERRVKAETGVELTAHFDPVDLNDAEAKETEERIRAAAEGIYEGLDLHDFRIVRGTATKVVFEAGVPFDCGAKDGEIRETLEKIVRVLGYEPAVTVERE